MRWAALAGGVLILVSQCAASLPYSIYPKSEFWLNSPAQVLTKQGVTFLLLAGAFLWTRYGSKGGWSWVRQLGITSLLVYWVHIELVYGRWLWFFKNGLTVPQAMLTALSRDSAHGGDFDHQDLPRAGGDGAGGDGLVVHSEAGARARRLGGACFSLP